MYVQDRPHTHRARKKLAVSLAQLRVTKLKVKCTASGGAAGGSDLALGGTCSGAAAGQLEPYMPEMACPTCGLSHPPLTEHACTSWRGAPPGALHAGRAQTPGTHLAHAAPRRGAAARAPASNSVLSSEQASASDHSSAPAAWHASSSACASSAAAASVTTGSSRSAAASAARPQQRLPATQSISPKVDSAARPLSSTYLPLLSCKQPIIGSTVFRRLRKILCRTPCLKLHGTKQHFQAPQRCNGHHIPGRCKIAR